MLDNFDAYLCHCRMCQRATGGLSVAFAGVATAGFQWHCEPEWYQSSAIARRPFCRECGTPLGFQYIDVDHKLDITVGSFDDPSKFVPTSHFGVEARHEAWLDTRGLPEMRCDEYGSLVERWENSGQDMPE